jgi:hypothetical protein
MNELPSYKNGESISTRSSTFSLLSGFRVAELQERGIHFDEPPSDRRWLWREARLKDPAGNQLILYYAGVNRKNPPWRVDG